jgi:hypothetical protein
MEDIVKNTTLNRGVGYSYMFRLIKSSSGWFFEPYNIISGAEHQNLYKVVMPKKKKKKKKKEEEEFLT